MDTLDDVAALAQLAQRRLGRLVHHPLAEPELMSEAETLQMPEAPDLQRLEWVGLLAWGGRDVDDTLPAGVAHKLPVELRPALGLDLAIERVADIEIAAQSQLLCDQVLGAGAHPLLDVVAGDDEVLAAVGDTAHDDVDMRVLRVPVIDGDPVELSAEILLHLADQLAGEALQAGHLRRFFRQDDEPEMVAVALTPLGEGLRIGILGLRTEQPGLLPVPGDTLAPEVAEMGAERRRARGVADDARLDRHQARATHQKMVRPDGGNTAAAEGRAAPAARRAAFPASFPIPLVKLDEQYVVAFEQLDYIAFVRLIGVEEVAMSTPPPSAA
jgi:hypothetical protein